MLFASEGKPIDLDIFSQALGAAGERIGIDAVRPEDLREAASRTRWPRP